MDLRLQLGVSSLVVKVSKFLVNSLTNAQKLATGGLQAASGDLHEGGALVDGSPSSWKLSKPSKVKF